jgi:hypothetical protein
MKQERKNFLKSLSNSFSNMFQRDKNQRSSNNANCRYSKRTHMDSMELNRRNASGVTMNDDSNESTQFVPRAEHPLLAWTYVLRQGAVLHSSLNQQARSLVTNKRVSPRPSSSFCNLLCYMVMSRYHCIIVAHNAFLFLLHYISFLFYAPGVWLDDPKMLNSTTLW